MNSQNQPGHKFNPMGSDNSSKQKQPAQQATAPTANTANSSGLFSPTLYSKTLVGLVVVLAVVFLLALGAHLLPKSVVSSTPVEKDQYQLVFLSNDQFYFGKLSGIHEPYVTLTDIYYLQVDRQVQPERDGEQAAQQNVSLTKLGNELHGPEDVMYISRDKIVYWENLKGPDESRVVEAINRYQQQGPAQNQNQQTQENQQQSTDVDTNTQQQNNSSDTGTNDTTGSGSDTTDTNTSQ